MNIILAIKPEFANAILDGIKNAELRRRVPVQLLPGDTIFLYHSGHIHGHVTFAGLNVPPPPGQLYERWLKYIAVPAAIGRNEARLYLDGASYPCALLLRYPVKYPTPHKYAHTPPQSFIYTPMQPTIRHPQLDNYLLSLKTHSH